VVLPTTPGGTVACWGNNSEGQVTGTRGPNNFSVPQVLPY
jgi:hypothetical protein